MTGRLAGWSLVVVLFTSQALAQQAEPLRWGTDAEGGAPYIFKNPKDPTENIGFEVDLAQALSRELKRPIEFKQYQFQNLIPGLDRGDIDLAMDGIEVTPDRKQQVRFSRPYYVYRLQLVARAGEKRFQDLAGCHNIRGTVGTMSETAAERVLTRLGIAKRSYDDPVGAYEDLAHGRIDAVLMDLPIAIYYAKPRADLQYVGEPFEKGYYAIAFSLKNEALARQFDAALDHLLKDGSLRKIYEKWNLWNADQDELVLASVEDIATQSMGKMSPDKYLPLLLDGAWETIKISFLGMGLAMAIGLMVALARLYGPLPIRWLAVVYVEFFRGIPVLILLVFLYYALPDLAKYLNLGVGFDMSAFQVAVLGFGLNYAAYEAEIYRAGIGSIPAGQWEAAASLGMSSFLTFRRIILPQAFRVILPPMTNDFVALFKDTSVVSIISVVELSKQYQIMARSSAQYLEIGLATAALYLIMSVPLGYLSRYLERRWTKDLGL